MESKPGGYARKATITPAWRQLKWLMVLLYMARCTEEPDTATNYITSSWTEQTIQFFSLSQSQGLYAGLETSQILGEPHILKRQSAPVHIILEAYTLESIPEELAEGIVFEALTIESISPDRENPARRLLMKKMLKSFGTICSRTLTLCNLDIHDLKVCAQITQQMNRGLRFLRGLLTSKEPEDKKPEHRCILKIRNLNIVLVTTTTIGWWQRHLDLSQSRINLVMRGWVSSDSLEFLDRFKAKSIDRLEIYGLYKLKTMKCKLLQDGPLPNVLVLESLFYPDVDISPQIVQNMRSKHWKRLHIPMSAWGKLMNPSMHFGHLTVDNLTISITSYREEADRGLVRLPEFGDNLAMVKSLCLEFYRTDGFLTCNALLRALDWVSRQFRDLEVLALSSGYKLSTVTKFIEETQFVIETNPGLASIKVNGIECVHRTEQSGPILCLSPEVWELYTQGKLGEELTRAGADLSQLTPEQEAMVMRLGGFVGCDMPCLICFSILDKLKYTNLYYCGPRADIYILDHPDDRACSRCLAFLVEDGREVGYIRSRTTNKEIKLPFTKIRISQNSQGGFEVLQSYLEVLSFPRQRGPAQGSPS
ncbi:hypothetical protein NEDG_01860 [Nematocida displodere]|uniref:Uncharacterized protein n=1 Tax=Nematocida displodere TaxID=1805483 RepID=A0A177EHA4_9MICR|nr:hypothetical protein NEDG_01860 [Nematocida displodere]